MIHVQQVPSSCTLSSEYVLHVLHVLHLPMYPCTHMYLPTVHRCRTGTVLRGSTCQGHRLLPVANLVVAAPAKSLSIHEGRRGAGTVGKGEGSCWLALVHGR